MFRDISKRLSEWLDTSDVHGSGCFVLIMTACVMFLVVMRYLLPFGPASNDTGGFLRALIWVVICSARSLKLLRDVKRAENDSSLLRKQGCEAATALVSLMIIGVVLLDWGTR